MRVWIVLLFVILVTPVYAQEPPPMRTVPEYSATVPKDVPDTTDWIAFGERGAQTELTKYSRYTGIFLSVLSPEGACTPETLPCETVVRFSFWRKDDSSDAMHVARFIAESNGRVVEGIAKTDRNQFWYWIKRADLWMPIGKNDDIYRAHEDFYVFLMLITEGSMLQEFLRQMKPPEGPKPKGKKVSV